MISNLFRLACSGALILATMASAAPVQPERPRPAIWLLSDEDTSIYLFGTIHMLPPGFEWRSPKLNQVIADADELVVETYSPPGEEPSDEEMRFFMAEKPSPILERVPEAKRAALGKAIAESPLPEQAFGLMQTWAAALVLGLAQLLGSYGVEDPSGAPGVEDVLEEAFRKAGKPIASVEDPVAVLRDLSALSPEVQAELLIQATEDAATAISDSANDNALWAAGKADAALLEDLESFPPALHEVIVRKRNAAWTDWLAERLRRPGTVLFAVGAGHLAGKDSVQTMLAARGLTVRRHD